MAGYAGVFRALADETRQLILEMLATREMAAGEIAAAFQMTHPAVSHHLSVLRQAGLVLSRRSGQQIIYSLDNSKLSECWSGFFARLLEDRTGNHGSPVLDGVKSLAEGGDAVAG